MKNHKIVFTVLVSLLVVIGLLVFINSEFLPDYMKNTSNKTQNNQITISVGETGNLNDVQITLIKILEDSRCPDDVNCVWPGEVIVEIKIETDDKDPVVTYISTLGMPVMNKNEYNINPLSFRDRAYIFNNMAISIEKVTPLKISTRDIEESEYEFVFSIK